jgi:hypothetical protein
MKAGLSETDADHWRSQIESGRAILLGVHVRSGRAADVETLLRQHSSGEVVRTQWED